MKLQVILPAYSQAIDKFRDRVVMALDPACIILYGSLARGLNTPTSDVDIVVVADALEEDFLERLAALNRFRDGQTPFELLGYRLGEWEAMMERFHLTVLEAVFWGIPLHGETLFEEWRNWLAGWQERGLRREEGYWTLPTPAEKLAVTQS